MESAVLATGPPGKSHEFNLLKLHEVRLIHKSKSQRTQLFSTYNGQFLPLPLCIKKRWGLKIFS